ncbi:blue light receptor [Varicellaria rhodocarpa]|nr:blue light receptor [Varicellaria rhodocarpa]
MPGQGKFRQIEGDTSSSVPSASDSREHQNSSISIVVDRNIYISSHAPAHNPPPAPTKVPDYTQNLIYPGLYAPSGFDMMNILIRVATRPNPKILIGAVDASCALVLCDVSKPDIPIVYCSEAFEKLTGYGKNEALGVNCRFLQSPDGKVQAGSKRLHDDNGRLFALKKRILTLDEAQTSIVNYKKGGQSFTNLLTMIPIRWDSAEIRFLVGFQVDERGLYL